VAVRPGASLGRAGHHIHCDEILLHRSKQICEKSNESDHDGVRMNTNPPAQQTADGALFAAIDADLEGQFALQPHQGSQTDENPCPDPARWYLIQCRPQQEERALEHLKRQRYQCYAPLRTVERVRDGRRQAASEPTFPGYLFIHLNRVNDNWRPIRSTRGVNRIVSFNGEPPPVANEIIEGIRARLNAAPVTPRFQPGERVCITEGGFAALEAIFVATKGEERIILLLEILQSEQRISFPASSVKKIK
jgi:transcriptional antiterminator RfaH